MAIIKSKNWEKKFASKYPSPWGQILQCSGKRYMILFIIQIQCEIDLFLKKCKKCHFLYNLKTKRLRSSRCYDLVVCRVLFLRCVSHFTYVFMFKPKTSTKIQVKKYFFIWVNQSSYKHLTVQGQQFGQLGVLVHPCKLLDNFFLSFYLFAMINTSKNNTY